MQVKVCPKCGVENVPRFPVCRRCQTSLASVAVTEISLEPQQPVTTGAGPLVSDEGGLNSYQGPVQSQIPPVQPPMGQPRPGPYGSPQAERRYGPPVIEETRPEPGGMHIGSVIGTVIILAVIIFGGLYLQKSMNAPKPKPAVPADQVVTAFLQAKSTKDIKQVAPYLSKASIYTLEHAFSGKQAESAGFDRKEVYNMFLWGVAPTPDQLRSPGANPKVTLVEDKNAEKDTAKVQVAMMLDMPFGGRASGTIMFVLVNEDKKWKVDLDKSGKENISGGVNPGALK